MTWTAVIVLHRSRAHLERLLASLDDCALRPRLVVVDSGPDDGGLAHAAARGATTIERRDNPGFGTANNVGLEHVDDDVTVLLNPDCVALDRGLDRLAALAGEHRRALHVPRLLDPDGALQRSAHPLPATVGAWLPAVVHPPLLPATVRDRVEPYRSARPRTVGWAIAACVAAPTALLRELGPFDPALHLYAEDLDLCLRARAAGVRTVYHPRIAVEHAGGHATVRSFGGEPHAILAQRRAEVLERRLGPRARRRDDRQQAVTFATRIAARRLLGHDPAREIAQLRALRRPRAAP